jgi:hypothetical protein
MAILDWSQCPAVESIPGKGQRRVGVQRYADAGFHCVRKSSSRGHYRRNHGVVPPAAGTDYDGA